MPLELVAFPPGGSVFLGAFGLAHLTAWRMLINRGALHPGETVLIHGIGSGVSLACLQLARLGGARVLVTLLYALRDRGKKSGIATLCIGGGEAVAVGVELT